MRRLSPLVLLTVLAACAGYETFQPPPLDYGDRAPLRFAVQSVAVESAYHSSGAPPYVENSLPLAPEAAVRALLEQRLKAAGGAGRLEAEIVDASVQEEKLATESGLEGMLTTEPASRFTGRIRVRVDRLDDRGNAIRSVTTAALRSRTVPEGAGFADRQRIGYELVRDLVDDFDAALVDNLEQGFADIILP
ncbi:MAG: hypothetical protein ACREH6_04230 [Geminicoccaceae bacterium]